MEAIKINVNTNLFAMFNEESINQIREALTAKCQTVAVAESVTGGFLQAAFSTGEKASDFFQGGITAYNVGQKCRHLDVDPVHAISCDCVSEKMAKDMANSAARRFTSDWGIGITGYATKVPESRDKMYAFCAVSFRGNAIWVKKLVADANGEQGLAVQLYYVNSVLKEFARLAQENKVTEPQMAM